MRDLATFAPRWSFRRRTLLQRGAPGPPVALLFDVDPDRHYPPRDRITASPLAGDPPALLLGDGVYPRAMDFDGTADNPSLAPPPVTDYSEALPFTVYLAIRPVAADLSGQAVLLAMVTNATNRLYVRLSTSGEVSAATQAANQFSVVTTSEASITAGQVHVIALEYTSLTSYTVWVDGTQRGTGTVISRDPGTFATLQLGSYDGSSLRYGGDMFRAAVASGAYSSEVNNYLMGAYFAPPRIPPGVLASDVLFLWDPRASLTQDWAGAGQTLSATGAVTLELRAGSVCALIADGAYLSGSSPFADFADEAPLTVYAVGELVTGGTIATCLTLSRAGQALTVQSMFVGLNGGGTFAGAAVLYAPFAIDYAFSGAVPAGRVERIVGECTSTTLGCWVGGVNAANSAHTTDPTALDTVSIGDIGGGFAAGRWYYVAMARGARVAAADAWLATEFPVGVTP